MKILIVTHYFLPHVGGIEIVAYNQAKELVKRGHEVTIISSRIGNEPEREVMDGIRIIRVKAWNFFEDKYGIPYPIYSPKILFILNKEVKKADIVHIHDLFYMCSFLAAIFSRLKNRPQILMQHIGPSHSKRAVVNFIQKIVFIILGRFILKNSKKILLCNATLENWLDNKKKIIFTPNAVDDYIFRPVKESEKARLRKKHNLPLKKKVVLFVGRLVEAKNFEGLFDARDKDYLIVFVGAGTVPERMKNNKNTIFIGAVNQRELKEYYQASDVFCLPSKNEGFPLTVLEAMACGLPIIVSNLPGYDRYLDEKFVKMTKTRPDEIKKSILGVLNNKALLEKMKNYSIHTTPLKYSWNKNVDSLIEIYKEVLNEHKNKQK